MELILVLLFEFYSNKRGICGIVQYTNHPAVALYYSIVMSNLELGEEEYARGS